MYQKTQALHELSVTHTLRRGRQLSDLWAKSHRTFSQ